MRQVVTTPRTARTRRPERVQALGPLTMGQPLDGSYHALHAVPWGLYWNRTRGLILEQQQAGAWVEIVPGQAFPALTKTARHIGLAFDQSARHVVCWEDQGQVVMRQWDQATQAYTYRGPFPGVDPLVFTDTTASYHSPDSDVLLIYLNSQRTTAFYRLQRDAYGVEYTLATGLFDAVLDQIVALPYGAQIRGECEGADWVLGLGLYPLRSGELVAGRAQVTGGVLEQLLFERGAVDRVAALAALSSGFYESVNLAVPVTDRLAANAAIPQAMYLLLVVPAAAADTLTGQAGVTAGAYPLTLVSHASPDTLVGSAGITGGTYGP